MYNQNDDDDRVYKKIWKGRIGDILHQGMDLCLYYMYMHKKLSFLHRFDFKPRLEKFLCRNVSMMMTMMPILKVFIPPLMIVPRGTLSLKYVHCVHIIITFPLLLRLMPCHREKPYLVGPNLISFKNLSQCCETFSFNKRNKIASLYYV